MTQLAIAEDFSLPLEIVTQAVGILAKRRAGKSYTARKLTEQLHKAGQQVVVVDPKGDWWGLRSSGDGSGSGLAFIILGGEHGDIQIEASGGEALAQFVVEQRVSAILDLSSFRKHEIATFMAHFLETLYRLKAKEYYRTPMMLMVDEADAIAPQKPQPGEARMLGAAEDIVRRGGQRGIGCTMVTQRAAVLNKNVLTQVQLIIALCTIAPQDLEALNAWIDVHGTKEQRVQLMDSLPSLPTGTAWFWSPGWPTSAGIFQKVCVAATETYDSSATPKPGEVRAEPRGLADIDLDHLREQLAAITKRVTIPAKATKPPQPGVEVERVEVSVLQGDQFDQIAQMVKTMRETAVQLLDAAQKFSNALLNAQVHFVASPVDKPIVPLAEIPQKTQSTGREITHSPSNPTGSSLPSGARTMLQVLVRHYPMKVTRAQFGALSGYAHSGGTFGTYFSALKRAGFIVDEGGLVQATPNGLARLGYSTPPPHLTSEQLIATWRQALQGGPRKLLDELIKVYPQALSRDELAARSGYEASGGTFGTYLGTLRRNSLIENFNSGIRASGALFLAH